MRVKKTLKSGAILELDYTSFKNSFELIQVIASIIKKDLPNFEIDSNFIKKDFDYTKLMDKIIPIICNAVGDNNLLDVIIKCGDNSLINDERITKEYFEDVNNRQDFFPVMFEVVKYNITPFISPVVMK